MTEPNKPRKIDPAFIEVDTPTHRFTTSVVRNDLVDPPFKTYSVQMTDRHPEFKSLCEALNRYSGQQLGVAVNYSIRSSGTSIATNLSSARPRT